MTNNESKFTKLADSAAMSLTQSESLAPSVIARARSIKQARLTCPKQSSKPFTGKGLWIAASGFALLAMTE